MKEVSCLMLVAKAIKAVRNKGTTSLTPELSWIHKFCPTGKAQQQLTASSPLTVPMCQQLLFVVAHKQLVRSLGMVSKSKHHLLH